MNKLLHCTLACLATWGLSVTACQAQESINAGFTQVDESRSLVDFSWRYLPDLNIRTVIGYGSQRHQQDGIQRSHMEPLPMTGPDRNLWQFQFSTLQAGTEQWKVRLQYRLVEEDERFRLIMQEARQLDFSFRFSF